MLNQTQRTQLLKIARSSIETALAGGKLELERSGLDETLRTPAGAFVTLNNRQGDLRGCIGSIRPVAPLFEAVASNAINAAFRDPRFSPVTRDELAALHIEISVMGPVEAVGKTAEIVVGRDGLIISRGNSIGLRLPQVATEYEWDLPTFLSQTCRKAGLPLDAWRHSGTIIQKFSAEVFGE